MQFFVRSLLLFLPLTFLGQEKRDTLQLFYDINIAESDFNNRRVDSLCNTLKGKVFNAWVYGYADFLHTDVHNASLSRRRAEAVKQRILKNSGGPQATVLACEGRGEKNSHDNGDPKGEAHQRRVDLIYEVRPPNRVVDTRPTKVESVKTEDEHPDPVPIDVQELKKKGKIELDGLTFIPGRSTLLPSSVPVLQNLLTTLLQNPELKIEIQGHICCWSQPGDGLDYDTGEHKLSTNRAKTVYDYLIENGVEKERLTYKGYGHSRPRYREDSPVNEQKNRRVEIKVIE